MNKKLVADFIKAAATLKVPADIFLSSYRDFLGKFPKLAPIMQAYEKGELYPTPALLQISTILSTMKVSELPKEEKAMRKKKDSAGKPPVVPGGDEIIGSQDNSRTPPRYLVSLFTKSAGGGLFHSEDDEYKFHLYMRAEEKADRLLFSREDSVFCLIQNLDDDLHPVCTRIDRGDAMARQLKRPPNAATKRTVKHNASLGSSQRCHQTRSHFSHG